MAGTAVEEDGPPTCGLRCPTVLIIGTGTHSGATEEEVRRMLASVFATVPQNHLQLVSKAPQTAIAAIDQVIRRSAR